jgi:hypothetical protein
MQGVNTASHDYQPLIVCGEQVPPPLHGLPRACPSCQSHVTLFMDSQGPFPVVKTMLRFATLKLASLFVP